MKSDYDAPMPRRATIHSAGYDFFAPEDYLIGPDITTTIDTGIHLEDGDMPDDCVMLLFPRSSYGMRFGMRFLNTTGVIDADYRDAIMASVTSDVPFALEKGQRFMQGVIVQYRTLRDEISPTEERRGGVGSTGNREFRCV